MISDVVFGCSGGCATILLNRVDALNALTLGMVRAMSRQLAAWEADSEISTIVIEGAGERGFCAGGDIRALYDWGRAAAPEAWLFYREEYRLNYRIKHLCTPYIAIIDGIVMGGGVGVSVHGSYRVATPRTRFAMPETGIGLLPDVGGSYFLPRLPGGLGKYLVLTGARLNAADCLWAGIATHYWDTDSTPDARATLVGSLSALSGQRDCMDGKNYADGVANLLDIHMPPPSNLESPIALRATAIDDCFAPDNVVAILTRLDAHAGDHSASSDKSSRAWAQDAARQIRTKSPMSCAIALEQLRRGAQLDLGECLELEYRLVSRLMSMPDFYEGVRAVIIDKDNAPCWSPPDFATPVDITALCAPHSTSHVAPDLRLDQI